MHGSPGTIAKLLALPMFSVVIALVRYFTSSTQSEVGTLKRLVALKLVFFIVGAWLAIQYGPFANSDDLLAVVTGVVLVAAMAIQNALHRIFFPKDPPTALMTGSTTQIMLDFADLLKNDLPADARATARKRSLNLLKSVIIFSAGCAIAALASAYFGMKAFIVPPLVAMLIFLPDAAHEVAAAPAGN